MRLARILALIASLPLIALAGSGVPEIDPGSGVAALTLLTGCLLVLRASRQKK